jgi:hypothetical protein
MLDMSVNRIATEAYVSPIREIKPVVSNAERAEVADRLKAAVRAAPAAGTGLLVDLSV